MSTAPPRWRVPHVFTLIFGLLVCTALASLVVPGGSFERDADGHVIAGTFGPATEAAPKGLSLLFAVLSAPLKGLEAAGAIVAFILVIGGAFQVVEDSGAFHSLIHRVVRKLHGRELWVVPVAMTVFSVGGAVFGMSEEIIPFVLLFVPLVRGLGYSPVLAVAIPTVGAGVGFAGAMINPFTVGVAQAIAGLPPLSGWAYRTAVWATLTLVGIAFVHHGARNLRVPREKSDTDEAPVLTRRHLIVLAALTIGIGVMLWGIRTHGWYVTEIGAVFLAIGLVAGVVARRSADEIAKGFSVGAGKLLGAALVVGLARGVVVLAAETQVLDPALQAGAAVLEPMNDYFALNAMFVFQSALNIVVPSGSGQAALTMPIMGPLAELSGLTRQMAVLAFQLGDGFTNMITPTSAVLMGSLEAAGVRYETWFRFSWRLQLWLAAIGVAFLSIAVATHWTG